MKRIFQLFIIFLLSCLCIQSKNIPLGKGIKHNQWKITHNKDKSLTYTYKGKVILKNTYIKAKTGDQYIESKDYKNINIESEKIDDLFGKGQKFTVTYTDSPNSNTTLEQLFYFYSDKEYFLTEVFLKSDNDISSNYIAPLYSIERNSFLPNDATNRILRVPFDNDAFVHYLSSPLTVENVSFEVTSIFNGRSRNGLVVGSVEHDTWKTGIRCSTEDNQYITQFECFGGITHELTRDISDKPDRPSKEHGSIKGKSLKSPKILFGMFDDWRRGLEKYGEVNARIAPPRKWNSGTPFGWNSWAAMAGDVNYEGTVEVSDFIKNELEPYSFENDGVTYIGLDSFWDNFSEEQLQQFVERCKMNGQKAGIYWCPFSDWFGNAEADVDGTNGAYKYKDIYLYANGKPRKIESLAVDPTHPGAKQRMAHFINRFKRLGFNYVKLDFINNGILEADSFYNPKVTTGVQAYNEGMQYLSDLCGEDMFMALSIAPTFPSQYGTSKRISCDAWGAMTEGEWGTTGYMLNSLSFGWWLDRVYPFNDADHILLYKPQEADDYKEGANRARITSAVITGLYMLGDNFSLSGRIPGTEEARKKAKAVATNKEINDIARIGKSFYPLEGYTAQQPGKTETIFTLDTDKFIYIAVFNFDKDSDKEGIIDISRITPKKIKKSLAEELWTSTERTVENNSLKYSVPPQDARVYRIEK